MATNIGNHPRHGRAIQVQEIPSGELAHKRGREHLIKGDFQNGPKQFSNAAASLLPHTLILLEILTY